MQDLSSFFEPAALKENFDRLLEGHYDVIKKKHRVSIGADKIDLSLFRRDQDKHLRAVQRKVMQGRYTFSAFLEHEIPKVDSKDMRTISIASIRDTIVQRALYNYLYDQVDARLDDSIYGYRRGRSAHDAVKKIRWHFREKRVFVFDADLSKFFDEIDHETMMEKVNRLDGIAPVASKLIFRFLKTRKISPTEGKRVKEAKGKLLKYKPERRTAGVPQGGVLSGLLSNLYLAEFDQEVVSEFSGYVRYADDFVICCESKAECASLREYVKVHLPKGSRLNESKTTDCVLADRGVDFLGFRITSSKLRVRGRNIGKFKQRIDGVIAKQTEIKFSKWEKALGYLVRNIKLKIEGPREEDLQEYANAGFTVAKYRRSWIGFFRIVDDDEQIRQIDRWLRTRVKLYMWKRFRVKLSFTQLQEAGLPTLLNTKYKARKSLPIEPTDGLAISE